MGQKSREPAPLLGLRIEAGAKIAHLIHKALVQGLSRPQPFMQKVNFTL